ncbi:Calx-beta domain-containing protein [Aliikangiella sp. G2MR2-5]|uniref:Calx-beta domain-containing protein n=1 Tax=Aliikangiella sp. G2MR2-5 TaxID=2788943 RepID=UPI0018A9C1EC|nr:Calx-beta domain-containing protein [Aliikangiella sp. G2MR2-5]
MKNFIISTAVAMLGGTSLVAVASSTPKIEKQVATSASVKVSKALRDLKPLQEITPQRKVKMLNSGEPVPGVDLIKEVPNRFPFETKKLKNAGQTAVADPVLQTKIASGKLIESRAPTMGASFDGMTNPQGYVPPDTNGSVGPNHYVQTVNVSIAIWDKTGNQLLAPVAINQLWADFGGICETNNNGDPIVIYDRRADRWMISQFALSSGDNHQCIAVSQTADPTGAYFLYDFPYGELMNDYPHFGIFGDAYYMGVNQFSDSGWAGGGVAAYERDKMLIGAEAQQVIISGQGFSPEVFTPMPLDVDGLMQPPADMNQLFVWANAEGQSRLHVWEMDLDWSNPGATTFTEVTALDVAAYSSPSNAVQPNGEELDSLGTRSMFRTSYRNIDGQGKILFTHNVAGPNGQPAPRWYVLDVDHNDGHAVSVEQQGTFSPDSDLAPSSAARWMVSGAMDANGNVAIGYTVTDSNIFPSIHAATRLANDPAGEMTDEFVLVEGGGSQAQVNRGRWADYASMSVDPVDDCTFWYTNEYYKAENNNSLTWSTYIASFKVPSCTTGPSGQISGVVTDSESGDPIANATVAAGNISAVTDAQGNYTLTLPVGVYDLVASRYGWNSQQQGDFNVEADDELTSNFSLTAADQVEVAGVVTDSPAGRAVYAKVSAVVPGGTVVTYTNPETGAYSLPLFEGTTVNITARSEVFDGYIAESQDVLPLDDPMAMTVNFDLDVESSCVTPGYQFVDASFAERFEGDTFPPTGWTVDDNAGDGVVWQSALAGRGNITGTEGDAALIDSDAAGSSANADSSLMTPVINVSDISSTTLRFVGHYRTYTGADQVDLDINVDGAGWVNVLSFATGTQNYEVDLATQLEGATSFQLRWHYYNANWEWYASIDDVTFGDTSCIPAEGSVASGYVIDGNTGLPVNNASVMVQGNEVFQATTTPNDDMLNDGFIHFFLPTGAYASVEKYAYETVELQSAPVLASSIALNAPQFEVSEETIAESVKQGNSTNTSVDVSNTGIAEGSFEARLIKKGTRAAESGPMHQPTRHMGPKDMDNLDAKKIRYFPERIVKRDKDVPASSYFMTDITYGWGISRNPANNEFYIGDLALADAPADVLWRYDANGSLTGESIPLDFVNSWFADSTFDQLTGMLWQLNSGANECIHEIDVANNVITGNTICPDTGTAQRGLAHDPLTDTFYIGSWNDGLIHQFTRDGEILRSINTGLPIAGLAFNPSTGHLFASLNNAGDNFDVMVLDANSDELDQIEGINVLLDLDGDENATDEINSQAGLDIDCDGTLWLVDQDRQLVAGFASGETGACDIEAEWGDVTGSGTVAAGDSAEVELTLNGDVEPGEYEGTLVVTNNSPYGFQTADVSLEVVAVVVGEFTISDVSVDEGGMAEITVERINGSENSVSVDYATENGTAMAGDNYTAASGTLTWEDGDSDSKTISVQTASLTNEQGDLTFSVNLSNATGGAAIADSTATVTITNLNDDLFPGTFEISNIVVDEKGTAELTVSRVDGDDQAVSVDFATANGSAVSDKHYTETNGTLSWDDGDSEDKTITVAIGSLTNAEGDLSFEVNLSNATGGATISVSTATVTINNLNDDPKGGGSFGILLLVLSAFGFMARRKSV